MDLVIIWTVVLLPMMMKDILGRGGGVALMKAIGLYSPISGTIQQQPIPHCLYN